MSKMVKVVIGTGIALGVAVLGGFIFAKGRHIKKLFNKAETVADDILIKDGLAYKIEVC